MLDRAREKQEYTLSSAPVYSRSSPTTLTLSLFILLSPRIDAAPHFYLNRYGLAPTSLRSPPR
jgi:hypothetical protein